MHGVSDTGTTFLRKKLRPARYLRLSLDLAVLMGAFSLAYLLRFDFDVPEEYRRRTLVQLPLVVALYYGSLRAFGVYSFIWRYIGISELTRFGAASLVACVPLLVARMSLLNEWAILSVPLSVTLMFTVLAFVGTVGMRVLRRMAYEQARKKRVEITNVRQQPTLLVGAGRAGILTARELSGRRDLSVKLVGFVDDDPEKQGAVLQGLKVLGTTADLERIVRAERIDQVIITIAAASRDDLRRIVQVCESVPVKARVIPALDAVLSGKVRVSAIRDVDIEDLLARDPVKLESEARQRFVRGKIVMVTGAGGSIGSELCRQALALKPSRLLLIERCEPSLYVVHRELAANIPTGTELLPLIADIGDEHRMRSLFSRHRPDVVFHAAAHKHVPMMECNPVETLKNNVFGTLNLSRLAGEYGTEAFVLVSTDKAVRPSSMMGASKRLAELVIQWQQQAFATRFVAVRFGNVLGSAGSVIPVFREQIAAGGPVTVTHPDMERYFMTIPEASRLVMEAGAMGTGGEIFVLDMCDPVRILDLARRMIQLSGLRPHEDIPIVITGIRPGEKLREDLYQNGEEIEKTRHPKIFIGTIAPILHENVDVAMEKLMAICRRDDEDEARSYVASLIPEATVELAYTQETPTGSAAAQETPGIAMDMESAVLT